MIMFLIKEGYGKRIYHSCCEVRIIPAADNHAGDRMDQGMTESRYLIFEDKVSYKKDDLLVV